MPCLKGVTSLLCTGVLLVSVAVGSTVPQLSEGNHLDSTASRWHDDAFSMQTGGQICPRAGACELCQSSQIGQRDFHVCPDDGDAYDPQPCFYTSACRCHPFMLQLPSLLECKRTTTVFVEGKLVNVTSYIFITPGNNVPDQPCFTTKPLIDSCSKNCDQTCPSGDPPCLKNVKNGDIARCDADGCECVDKRWLQPDCCDCDFRNYHGSNCTKTCTNNCERPFFGGCSECNKDGYEPPSCCNCTEDRIKFGEICKCKNNTKADGSCEKGYESEDCCKCADGYTMNKNGECKKTVCRQSCAEYNSETGVCSACSGGFLLPTCCDCPSGKQNVSGVCKCKNNTKADGSCQEGYESEDCCKCADGYTMNKNGECKKTVCQQSCAESNSETGVCSACSGGFLLPTCCDCPSGKQNVSGVCKCKNNTKADGSCEEGYELEDCCKCALGYTMNKNEECKKTVCQDNCADYNSQTGVCSVCSNGFELPTCCKCPSGQKNITGVCEQECSREQNIYFLMDGSKGNKAFPSLLLAVQMLVAAFNPQPNQSGTKVSVVLFGDGSKYPPSVISTLDYRCEDINSTLVKLQKEFQVCRNGITNKIQGFESLCAGSSQAASGLNAIQEMITNRSSVSSALVIMTDGQLSELNDPQDRISAINALKDEKLNLQIMIAAGINGSSGRGASKENLRNYTRFSFDPVVTGHTAIDVGQGIVDTMAKSGIICADYATNIKAALAGVKETADLETNYRECHNPYFLGLTGGTCTALAYPECGGSVNIKAQVVCLKNCADYNSETGVCNACSNGFKLPKCCECQLGKRTVNGVCKTSSLEHEILAAVEKVLEMFKE